MNVFITVMTFSIFAGQTAGHGAHLQNPRPTATPARLPESLELSHIRRLVVQHDGRWPPLDTVARDFVESITGAENFRGRDAVLWLLAWTFDPAKWHDEPVIAIANAELRGEIGLDPARKVFSYAELVAHPGLRELRHRVARIEKGRKMDPLESKVADLSERLGRLGTVFHGDAIAIVPDGDDPLGTWHAIGSLRETAEQDAASGAALQAWGDMRDAFLADDAEAFANTSLKLTEAAGALPAAHRPAAGLIATELRYNELQPFRSAWQVMAFAAFLAAIAAWVGRRWFDFVVVTALVAGFAMVTYGLSLRWHIAGRIPASNMFESLLFLSWGMGLFAILAMFLFKHRIVPLTAAGMGALALFLADVLPLNHFIRPIAPVLMDTVWMSIHVPVIMVSYSVLALAVLVAHVQLMVLALSTRRTALADTIDDLHYWYVHVGTILLTAGIITGSMWAASSWGRYWGWDPKEVWSLVALLGYLTILHVRIDHDRIPAWGYVVGAILVAAMFSFIVPRLAPITPGKAAALAGTLGGMAILVLARGQFATAAKSIICFWLIIMTYVGVNFVLGIGLHSYGFGTGAVARYMFLLGGIDLGFVALCAMVYVARRNWACDPDLPGRTRVFSTP